MQTKIQWKLDQNAVQFSVQQDLVLQPTKFTLGFDALELIYAQMLAARINAREAAKQRVLRPT